MRLPASERPDEWVDRIFAAMALCPQHTFQVLTKRAKRMRNYLMQFTRCGMLPARIIDAADTFLPRHDIRSISWTFPAWPLANVWLGVSVDDRARLPRIDELRATPAALRFLSLEPLLEDLGPLDLRGIDWVVVGGESGPGARPFDLKWACSIITQYQRAGVPVFMKQLGRKPVLGQPGDDGWGRLIVKDRKGGDRAEWPPALRVREYPRGEKDGDEEQPGTL